MDTNGVPPLGMRRIWTVTLIIISSSSIRTTRIQAAPLSKPFIAFRTDPLDQNQHVHHALNWNTAGTEEAAAAAAAILKKSTVVSYDTVDANQCPLQFTVGLSQKLHISHSHHASSEDTTTADHHQHHHHHNDVDSDDLSSRILAPIVLQTVFPARGAGRQVIYTTAYEHVDLLSPAKLSHSSSSSSSSVIKEALVQASSFPLLFESSSFGTTSPILHDVNGDGIMDIIVADYDGGISIVGTSTSTSTTTAQSQTATTPSATTRQTSSSSSRYFHHTQVPRLYVRRSWMTDLIASTLQGDAATNATPSSQQKGPSDPFHSYFEYYYSNTDNEQLMRGISANVLGQDTEHVTTLAERRQTRRTEATARVAAAAEAEATRRLEPVVSDETTTAHRRLLTSDAEEMLVDVPVQQQQQEQTESIPQVNAVAADTAHATGGDGTSDTGSVADQKSEILTANVGLTEGEHQGEGQIPPAGDLGGNSEQANESNENQPLDTNERRREDVYDGESQQDDANYRGDDQALMDDVQIPELDQGRALLDDDVPPPDRAFDKSSGGDGDSGSGDEKARGDDAVDVDLMQTGDDLAMDRNYGMMDDYQHRLRTGSYDDQYSTHHNTYYDSSNYIRIPPHILTTPVLVEVPKLYGNANVNEKDDMLLVAVSYYLDEDEYEGLSTYKRFQMTDKGDETEASRGGYVASAIMGYFLGDSSRWTGQTHLDLSTDFSAPENATMVGLLPVRMDLSKMAAFALSSPTVADLDGDGSPEVIIGTSMGMIYAFEARQMVKRENWPVQLKRPVEHRILVEDVVGNTNLEIFVSDIGGTVVCLDHKANIIWHRNLPDSLGIEDGIRTEMSASSPMTLGDVDGDGVLDIVQLIRINQQSYLFALVASTGKDLPRFPIELDGTPAMDQKTFQIHHKFPQPLLVDLHSDQSFLNDYLRRNGTAWKQRQPSTATKPLHGGSGPGLHIVQPHGDNLFIVEGYSGCTQKVSIGEEVSSMVQADDVHATNKLDLVVATESGSIVTLESQAVYHPLNTWTGGEVRGRSNLHAHGYSASQGIFVHQMSRQFVDIFGVYVPVTFEIFDNRPNIANEPDKRKYVVEIRDGPSWKRVLWRNTYTAPGVYTDRVYIRYGPGYYTLSVNMLTTHGIIYEDMFSIGYNVGFLDGFGVLLWLPLLVSALVILLCGAKKAHWDDDDDDDRDGSARDGQNLGILGRLPT